MSIVDDSTTDSTVVIDRTEHHALIVDADGAVEFLRKHPGWCIFPGQIKWDGSRWQKLPLTGLAWGRDASDDPTIVRGLWSAYTGPDGLAAVAVHVGKSQLVVLDQDAELTDPVWIEALKGTTTLVLASCTRKMPHYVFQQHSSTDIVDIQDWPGGEVKSKQGYIFISDHPPISGVVPLTMPPHIVKMLHTSLILSDDYASVKMSHDDLDTWLQTTPCQIENGEDALIAELVDSLLKHADTGHRRDAMRGACMTLAIEATAGLYDADKAWTALIDAYADLRNDPGKNGHQPTKTWSPFWEKDSRVLLAGAVEKVEAGRFDEAIQEKRDRFSIWTPEETAAWMDFFETAIAEESAVVEDEPETLTSHVETPSPPPSPAAPPSGPESSPEPPPAPEPVVSPSADYEPSVTPLDEGDNTQADHDIDPHAKLRKEVEKRGGDLSLIQRYAQNFTQASRPYELEAKLGTEVQKLRDRRLIKHIADTLDAEPVLPSDWDWLKEGGYAAVLERSPGTMLQRSDKVGLLYDRGCVHFIGDKSTGKSWLLTVLGVERMRLGETFAWFDYETDEQQVAERFIQAGASLEDIIDRLKYFGMKGEPIAGAVETLGQIHPLPSVVVVDSVDASMAASGSEDENSSSGYHAWRNTLTPLTELMLVALIEHTGHENSHRARGASAKGQQADQEFSAEVVKAFSKEEPGLVKWICRKNRRGSVFTTGDVAAYVMLSPLGSRGPIPACIDIEILPPNDRRVTGMAIQAAADEVENEMRVLVDFLDAHLTWYGKSELIEAAGLGKSSSAAAALADAENKHFIKVDNKARYPKYASQKVTGSTAPT